MKHDNKHIGSNNDVVRPYKGRHTKNKRLVISVLAIITAAAIVTVELTKSIEEDMITY